jgi:nucleoside-diphosphate-sugar epimerase
VTDDDVTSLRRFFTDVVEATGQPAKARVVPYWVGVLLARMMGFVFAVFRPGEQPPLTLEAVRLIGNHVELSNALAKRELGYAPKVSRAAGVSRLQAATGNKGVGGNPSARA